MTKLLVATRFMFIVFCARYILVLVLCELAAVTYALLFGVGLQKFMMQCLVVSLTL